MNPFPPESTGAQIYDQLEPRLCELKLVRRNPTQPHLIHHIQTIPLEQLLGQTVMNQRMAQAVKTGLYVALDAWEEAHAMAQELDAREGSYWHGIVHRREPDADNAKYWFRRVGRHPVFQQLAAGRIRQSLLSTAAFDRIVQSGSWDPFTFIDLCLASQSGQEPELKAELLALQTQEIQLLLEHCLQGAIEQ